MIQAAVTVGHYYARNHRITIELWVYAIIVGCLFSIALNTDRHK